MKTQHLAPRSINRRLIGKLIINLVGVHDTSGLKNKNKKLDLTYTTSLLTPPSDFDFNNTKQHHHFFNTTRQHLLDLPSIIN